MWYYLEFKSTDRQFPSKEFVSDNDAIRYFRVNYGDDLMVVIRDNDPDIAVVWENK